MTTSAEIQDQIKRSNTRFSDSVQGIPAGDLETEQICGHWSARDVTLHLADWSDWLLVGIDQALSGETTDEYPMTDPYGFNDIQAETYGDTSWADAMARLNNVTASAVEVAGSLSADQLGSAAVAPWDEEITIVRMLEAFPEHQDDHVTDLETFAKQYSASAAK